MGSSLEVSLRQGRTIDNVSMCVVEIQIKFKPIFIFIDKYRFLFNGKLLIKNKICVKLFMRNKT